MDQKLVSNTQYHELAMINSDMVRSYKVQSATKDMSSCIPISNFCVGDSSEVTLDGSYRDVKDILDYLFTIPEFYQRLQNINCPTLHLRFAGDGAKTSRNKNTIVLCFNIIDDENAALYEYNYPIAICNGHEDYAFVKSSLEPIIESMKILQEHGYMPANDLFHQKLNIEWFLCADWKFLALILRINPANNKYFCIWCDCDKGKIHQISTNKWKCTRTIAECVQRYNSSSGCKYATKGIQDLPLLDFIDFDHIVPDTLHLFLRVTDVLYDELVRVVLERDIKDSLVAEMAKIKPALNFSFTKDDKGKLIWPSYDGPHKRNILKQLDIKSLLTDVLPDIQVNIIVSCWKRFDNLDSHLRSSVGLGLTPDRFQKEAMAFANEFMAIFKDRAITPYIHTLVYHVPEYLLLYGSLAPFNMQAVERVNYMSKQVFFKKLNKKEYCTGLLQFFNRILFARKHKLLRTKRPYTFSGKYTKTATQERRENALPRSVLAKKARDAKLAKSGRPSVPT